MELPLPDGATPLDPNETEGLIPSHITTNRELNEWEQANILQAEIWLFERTRVDLLTEPFVRELHFRMFNGTWDWAGTYRKTAKNFGVPAHQIASAVSDACDNTAHQLVIDETRLHEIAVKFHHRLVFIHPFPNGNGRHTRLMADALSFQHGGQRFTWGSANLQVPGEVRDRYVAALRDADQGNFGPLIRFART